ncbi:MAG: glycosyltransferase family 4 protein [Planctomycetaceae bacterium]|nr:glycosyltransferase family 4 protein [Planctomycetaceae bacterium]
MASPAPRPPTNSPRLLLLCEYPTVSGGEQSMLSTIPFVEQAGFSVTVACPQSGPLATRLGELQVDHIPFDTQTSGGQRFPQNESRQQLRSLLVREKPDLLHANSLSTGRLSGPVAADLGIPSVAHLRDIVGLSRRAVADLNQHRRLLAVSEATRDFHLGQGVSAARTFVLHNGVDLQHFRPGTERTWLRNQLELPPSSGLVVTVGQIGLRKGHDVLVDAAIRVSAELPHVHWLVVGERFSQKDESRQFEADLHEAAGGPLGGQMHLLGWRDDVDRILREADLLVHASRQEPLGRVLLEAAASGLPVVATDVGGTREIFPSEDEGAILVPAGDAPALAEAIVRVLADEAVRKSLARAIRRRAEAAFDLPLAAANLVEHYRQVLQG